MLERPTLVDLHDRNLVGKRVPFRGAKGKGATTNGRRVPPRGLRRWRDSRRRGLRVRRWKLRIKADWESASVLLYGNLHATWHCILLGTITLQRTYFTTNGIQKVV